MTIESVVPATPLEVAIREVRVAQAEYDEACETHDRLVMEVSEARVHRDTATEALNAARENMYIQVAKPTQYVAEPIRVMPTYREEAQPQIEEGVDAAWSDKGPDS